MTTLNSMILGAMALVGGSALVQTASCATTEETMAKLEALVKHAERVNFSMKTLAESPGVGGERHDIGCIIALSSLIEEKALGVELKGVDTSTLPRGKVQELSRRLNTARAQYVKYAKRIQANTSGYSKNVQGVALLVDMGLQNKNKEVRKLEVLMTGELLTVSAQYLEVYMAPVTNATKAQSNAMRIDETSQCMYILYYHLRRHASDEFLSSVTEKAGPHLRAVNKHAARIIKAKGYGNSTLLAACYYIAQS